MTRGRPENGPSLLEQVEACRRRGVPRGLAFERALETAFQSDRLRSRGRQAYWAGWSGVLIYAVLVMASFLAGAVRPEAMPFALFTTYGLAVLPCLALLAALRRNRSSRRNDWLLLAGFALVLSDSLMFNASLAAELRVFNAFALVLSPVACNIALPISFRRAVVGTFAGAAALVAAGLGSAPFPPEAQATIFELYAAAGALTLAANYRFERTERIHFLDRLRESLLNAAIVRANDELDHLSRTDFLTGLANRREFDARLAEALAAAATAKRPLALLLADVDCFKAYNDRFGHQAGDACLGRVARAIGDAVEGEGFVARWGGEEFAVALPGSHFAAGAATAERIRAAVVALALPHPGNLAARHVTVSIGAASFNPDCPEDAASLVFRADAALYRAKRRGRDRTEIDQRARRA